METSIYILVEDDMECATIRSVFLSRSAAVDYFLRMSPLSQAVNHIEEWQTETGHVCDYYPPFPEREQE